MSRALALLLLAGSLLLLVAMAFHPILPLTAAGDLALIQATPHWRVVHLGLLYATGLIIAGVWARWTVADGSERAGLGTAFVVFGLGQALNGVNIAYMTGAGTYFGGLASADPGVAAIYQGTHAFAVMCGRLGGFLVAVAAGLVAVTTGARREEPRWLVGIAWLACGAGLAGNLFAPPGHPLMLTSIGVMAVWQTVTAGRVLGEERVTSDE
jgi:hypothetical protein